MKKLIFLITIVMLFSGCAASRPDNKFSDRYVGKNISREQMRPYFDAKEFCAANTSDDDSYVECINKEYFCHLGVVPYLPGVSDRNAEKVRSEVYAFRKSGEFSHCKFMDTFKKYYHYGGQPK
jgi:hypothetical protein